MNKISKKKKIKIFMLFAALAVVLSAAGFTIFIRPQMNKEELVYKENKAAYGILKNGVTESGSLTYGISTQMYDLDISLETDEDEEEEDDENYLKIEEIYVAVGQRIKEGDAICKFTEDSISDVRKALKYAETECTIELSEAQSEYEVGALSAQLLYDETMLTSSLAQQDYDNQIARLTNDMAAKTLEIEQLLSDIYNLQLSLVDDDYREERENIIEAYNTAKEDVEEASESFVTKRVETAQAFTTAKESYENFFNQFETSNEEIQNKIDEVYELQSEILYSQILMEKDILKAQQSYESAKLNGDIADNTYSSSLKGYENSLKKAEEELSEIQQLLSDFEEFVGDGTVYAKGDGIVTSLGYSEGDYLISEGILISYAENDNMTISVDVAEEDIISMKVGDNVDILFSAYPDTSYEGIIKSITTTSTSQNTATVSYPVVISVKGDTSKLYEGMTADITFITDVTSNEVVYIPGKAVIEHDNKKYVYKKSGDDYIISPIETGFFDGVNVEITNGLSKGETYYTVQTAIKEEKEKNSGK